MDLVIIDYGAGNIANVRNAFKKLGFSCRANGSETEWEKADALVLPGVGAFGAAMKNLGAKSRKLKTIITENETPFFGVCLGMQLLMEGSEESPGAKGLGIIKGSAKRFRTALPVPHMGWNKVKASPSPFFDGIEDFFAYFVHSYYCVPVDNECVSATTAYGAPFASAVSKGRIFATQFHPEKSGESGLRLLANFVKGVRR
ncbi:MAG: imidazole glycerol phosphate synthase subunit HisH [Candidatus Micrarchaeota archaeon]